jgi:carbon monoxide dehydrogenase subunit G
VQAALDRVWGYLVDPSQVVACLPGAELTSVEGETFHGRVKAKVGPVSTSYTGVARLMRVDEAEHSLELSAEGKEVGGSGSARLTMRASLHPAGDGTVEVRVTATVDIVGRVMQFGRAMVEMVARQLFADFARCVGETLRQPAADAGVAADAPSAAPRPVEPLRPVRSVLRGIRARIAGWIGRGLGRGG